MRGWKWISIWYNWPIFVFQVLPFFLVVSLKTDYSLFHFWENHLTSSSLWFRSISYSIMFKRWCSFGSKTEKEQILNHGLFWPISCSQLLVIHIFNNLLKIYLGLSQDNCIITNQYFLVLKERLLGRPRDSPRARLWSCLDQKPFRHSPPRSQLPRPVQQTHLKRSVSGISCAIR